MKILLVTGGAGFAGSHFIKYFLRRNKNFIVVNIDSLSYNSGLESLKELDDCPRYHFIKGSISNIELINYVLKRFRPDYIINFACEHGTIKGSQRHYSICESNIMGTLSLIEGARYIWEKNEGRDNLFVQISTDEVYGVANNVNEYFIEESPYKPTDPFSASKAAAEMLVKSYISAYNFPAVITRCCRNYGPWQHEDNFIPSCISSVINDRKITLESDAHTIREWIHVLDHSVALIRVLFYGKPGQIYNIGSGEEASEIDIAKKIARLLGKPDDIVEATDRISEIKRCTLNSYKARTNLVWSSKYKLDDGLAETVKWYKSNPAFLN